MTEQQKPNVKLLEKNQRGLCHRKFYPPSHKRARRAALGGPTAAVTGADTKLSATSTARPLRATQPQSPGKGVGNHQQLNLTESTETTSNHSFLPWPMRRGSAGTIPVATSTDTGDHPPRATSLIRQLGPRPRSSDTHTWQRNKHVVRSSSPPGACGPRVSVRAQPPTSTDLTGHLLYAGCRAKC